MTYKSNKAIVVSLNDLPWLFKNRWASFRSLVILLLGFGRVKKNALSPLRDVYKNPVSSHGYVPTPTAPTTRSRNILEI